MRVVMLLAVGVRWPLLARVHTGRLLLHRHLDLFFWLHCLPNLGRWSHAMHVLPSAN